MMSDSGTIDAGRAAWARIKENARTSWNDWVLIGKALIAGRSEAMKAAKINRPFGATYVRIFGAWLREHELDGIDTQQRYRCILCTENLRAIEEWRATLDDKKRNAWNHPGAIWAHWRRSLKTEITTPKRRPVQGAKSSHRPGKPIYFGQDMIRRAAMALRECGSPDIFRLARVALEAAIRSEADLVELLDPHAVAMSALPQRTDVVSAAGYVD
jgi:hypothetical protein